jgi:hypothetical protein
MTWFFAALTAAQLFLGFWRARMIGGSVQPAIALAALIAFAGLLFATKRTHFAALLLATVGALSSLSALNAPLIGTAARISIPLFAFTLAALLMTAGLQRRYQWTAAAAFAAAFLVLQYDLTRDARWESRAVESRAGGTQWNTKSSAT